MNITEFVFIISSLTGGAIYAPNGYIDAGVALHNQSLDAPEINNLGTSLFEYEVGVKNKKVSLYFRHTSGIQTQEEGAGLNVIGIKVRLK